MEEWDQEMLEKVIESKGKEYNQNKPTDIVCFFKLLNIFHKSILPLNICWFNTHLEQVCKHFLDAVERKQYGWFWVCPNGNKECHYRHALPPGYILKSQMKALLEEEANKLAIEDEIEDQVKIPSFSPKQLFFFVYSYTLHLIYLIPSACKSENNNSNDYWSVYGLEEDEDGWKRSWIGCSKSREG